MYQRGCRARSVRGSPSVYGYITPRVSIVGKARASSGDRRDGGQ